MRCKLFLLAGLGALMLAGPLLAQPEAPQRQRMRRLRDMPPAGPGRRPLVPRLIRELQLSPQQREQLEQIMQRHFERMRELRQQPPSAEQARRIGQQMRRLRRQLRQAQQDGQTEKVNELRQQLRKLRLELPGQKLRQELFAEIEAILTDQQKAKFQRLREELETMGPGPDLTNPAVLRMALRELELSAEQQEQIDELFSEFRQQRRRWRNQQQGRPEPQRLLEQYRRAGQKLYRQVLDVLTPQQREKLRSWRPQMRAMPLARNPRLLRRMLQRIELTEDQQDQIETLYDRLRDDMQALERDDRQGRRQLAKKFHDEVMELLTPQQKEQLRRQSRWGSRRWAPGPRRVRPAPQPAPTD